MATMEFPDRRSPGKAWEKPSKIDLGAEKLQKDVDNAEKARDAKYMSHRAMGQTTAEAERRAQAEARLESALAPYSGGRRAVNKDCTMCLGTGKVKGWFNSNQCCWKCKGTGSQSQPGA